MKKNLRFLAMAVLAMAAAVFTGCSSDDDFLAPYEESAIQTRATPNPDGTTTITFDDFAGNKLATYTKVLADYRNGKNENPVTTWTYWPINQAGVGFVKFNFSGSDTGEYGLNTPAYLCIDDIVFEN